MPTKTSVRPAGDAEIERLPVSRKLIEQAYAEASKLVPRRYNPEASDVELMARADLYRAFSEALIEHQCCKRGSRLLPYDGSDTHGRERPIRKILVGSSEHVGLIASRLQFALTLELSFKIAREIAKDRLL